MSNLLIITIFSISPLKGALASLLIPGLGEKLAGNNKEFYIMLSGELALLGTYFVSHFAKKEIRNNYIIYATINANANNKREDEDYWYAVENYFDYESYIEYLRRKARAIYPSEPSKWDEYIKNNAVGSPWEWKDTTSWNFFLTQRERERYFESRMKILKGFLITYHIASAIFTFMHLKIKNTEKVYLKGNFDFIRAESKITLNLEF